MAASELQFTKSWTSSEDFPTYEPDETKVRADMQLLFDEIKNHINTVLLPDLLKRVPDTRKVNGHALTGDITVSKGDVGLGNVDNTSDADKPVSAAQQAALDAKTNRSDVLEKDNTTPYTPTQDYHPSTKEYVDAALAGAILGQVPDHSIGAEKLTPALNTYIDQQMPKGGIIMWSGTASNIPSGWALCDGQNGTPNLCDRFIVGAGGAYPAGSTGGAAAVQLSVDQLPAHSHTFSNGQAAASGEHTHGNTFSIKTAGKHTHSYTSPATGVGGSGGYGEYTAVSNGTTGESGAHTHEITGSVSSAGTHTHSVTGTIGNTGSGTAFSILPPYYALCFIMKL